MMDLEKFDEAAMKKLEDDDDIDDMFYWDPTQGCTEGKKAAKNNGHNKPTNGNGSMAGPQQSYQTNQYKKLGKRARTCNLD